MKRTYQPKKRKRARTHGFRARMRTRSGRQIIKRRRRKGRKRLSAVTPGERRRRGRLSRSGDFDRVYREGRSHANRFLVLYAFPRRDTDDDREEVRLGISVSRKVGGAVERNAVKRGLREAFWSFDERLPRGHDFVLVARPDAAGLVEREGPSAVAAALEGLISEAGPAGGAV